MWTIIAIILGLAALSVLVFIPARRRVAHLIDTSASFDFDLATRERERIADIDRKARERINAPSVVPMPPQGPEKYE